MATKTGEQLSATPWPPQNGTQPFEDRLQNMGVVLSQTHHISQQPDRKLLLLKRLSEQESLLRAAHSATAADSLLL